MRAIPAIESFPGSHLLVSKDLCRAAPTSMLAKSTWGAKDHDDICMSQFPPLSPSQGTRKKNGKKGKKKKKNKNKILNKYITRWWWSPQPIHQQLPLLLLTKLPKLSLSAALICRSFAAPLAQPNDSCGCGEWLWRRPTCHDIHTHVSSSFLCATFSCAFFCRSHHHVHCAAQKRKKKKERNKRKHKKKKEKKKEKLAARENQSRKK